MKSEINCQISYNSNDIQSKRASAQEEIEKEREVREMQNMHFKLDAIFERSKRKYKTETSDLTHANFITADGNDSKLIRCTVHMWIMGRREANEVSSMQIQNEIVMANCNMRYSLVCVCSMRRVESTRKRAVKKRRDKVESRYTSL